jgi:hypothetical protein
MSLGQTTYDVSRPTGICAKTGDPIVPGDPYVACLVEANPDLPLARLDYSLPAWEDGARPAEPVFGSWRATMIEPDAKPRQFIDDNALCDLFEQLESNDEDRRIAFRFLLTLVLVRKRLLHLARTHAKSMLVQWTRRSGRMTAPSQGEEATMNVIDPGLDESRVAELSEEIGAIVGDTSP